MKKIALIILFFLNTVIGTADDDRYIDTKVKEIISQMTLEEKLSQMSSAYQNAIPRLNLPEYKWHNECAHGVAHTGVTVFPAPINFAATFNPELIKEVANAISDEARILFNQQAGIGLNFWSPNLDLARDPRWGRTQETYGEDPYLASRMAVAFVKGIQGEHPVYLKAILSPKHYTVHSGPETERHWINPKTSQKDFWEYYMKPFESGVVEGGAYSMMTAYNAYGGVPISVNKFLVNEVLRKKWGMRGFVVTDCGALSNVVWSHWYAPSPEDAVAMALHAGVDSDCGDFFAYYGKSALEKGLLTEADIDSAVFRLLKARFKVGALEKPDDFPFDNIPDSLLSSYKHRDLARETARQSIVLLKNENSLLPLDKNIKSIFLVGPNGPTYGEMLGSYHGWPKYWFSIYDGLRAKLGKNCKIDVDRACEFVGSLTELIKAEYFTTIDGHRGLIGEYFNNKNLEGSPVFTRIDSIIDFSWQRKSPVGGKDGEPFSVRWTGYITAPETAEYTFKTINNDGTRLYINDKKILDNWWDHGASPFIGFYTLEKGKKYKIVLEYYFNQSFASVRMEWGTAATGQDYVDSLREKAKNFDVVIFAGGISSIYENEELGDFYVPGFYGGDRTTLELPPTQTRLLKALVQSGTPVVLLTMSGTCLAINWEKENIPAILHTWYAGQEAGLAIADILFGDYNPSGRTPITWYKTLDDLPDFKNYYLYNRTYLYYRGTPLYPFGYGLSYTKFDYKNLVLPGAIDVCKTDTLMLTLTVSNTGNYNGSEVVQVYIRNQNSKFIQPVKALKAFKKVFIPKGEEKTITIPLVISELATYDSTKKEFVIEQGNYEVFIGASSEDIRLQDTVFIKNCITDTSDKNIFNGSLYPNPANETIYFHPTSQLYDDRYSLRIFNVNGMEANVNISRNVLENLFTIDCSTLAPGVYILRYITGTDQITEKFVIIK